MHDGLLDELPVFTPYGRLLVHELWAFAGSGDFGLVARSLSDPDRRDERRAATGMQSAADYDRRMHEVYRGRR